MLNAALVLDSGDLVRAVFNWKPSLSDIYDVTCDCTIGDGCTGKAGFCLLAAFPTKQCYRQPKRRELDAHSVAIACKPQYTYYTAPVWYRYIILVTGLARPSTLSGDYASYHIHPIYMLLVTSSSLVLLCLLL